MTTCKNCYAEINSAFCPSCGQRADVHRVTTKHILHEGFHSVTHADKGFLFLLKDLLIRPGFIAKEYIDGRHKKYFNPLTFLVISSALFYYVGSVTGFMDALTGSSRAGGGPMTEEWMQVMAISKNAGKWLTLLLIVPLSASLSWIFFIGKKFNYAEHFILHSFILGEAAFFRMIVMIPLSLLFPGHIASQNWMIYEPLFLIYLTVAYHQFFNQHWGFTFIKAILIRVLFIVLYWTMLFGYVIVKSFLV